ncbi:helix-turn-helix domain-containing protein [Enterococcus entomosocium]|uniref:helix-turn-helix domain-containing protein n=1 Tax=Enterococcus TaxID=1350 RepID=UPI001C468593
MGVQISKAKPIQIIKTQAESKKKQNKVDWKKAKFVASYLGVSLATVSRWTNQKDDPLPSRRLRGVLQYDFEEVKEWETRNSN